MQTNLYGTYRAVVTTNRDPTRKNRIRVKAPQVSGNAELDWAEPINPGSPIPSTNAVVWVMFNGGYINKPVYLPMEPDLEWTQITPVTGYTHDGNGEGNVSYTTYTFRGTTYVEWQGGLDVASTGSEGSYANPNAGLFYTLTDTALMPSSRRTVLVGKNTYVSANYLNNSGKIDFNTDGTCNIVGNSNFAYTWISLNGIRYPL